MESARDHIRRSVAGGFAALDGLAEDTVETYFEELEGEEREQALAEMARLVEEELERHSRAQATWPPITDCDRLDAAFGKLENEGVLARQDFTCCGTCGVAEIEDEIAEARGRGVAVRGYTFFHWQDTEAAVDGHGLCLNYGAVVEGEAAALAIGGEVARTLEAEGLEVKWDGTWAKRIAVSITWRRRRASLTPGAARPAAPG